MPARVEEVRHAKEEGIEFLFMHSPTEILLDNEDNVRGMELQRLVLGEPDDRGRRKPVPLDDFVNVQCDTVIYALGTKPNPIIARSTPGLMLNERGNIAADGDTQCTSLPGIFAGGDIVTGGATVIMAMGAGRRAASAIETWLRNGKTQWPVAKAGADPEVCAKVAL
jgi:NADPH-dependent glutamate synthase beta subunit-like oxidoreductase